MATLLIIFSTILLTIVFAENSQNSTEIQKNCENKYVLGATFLEEATQDCKFVLDKPFHFIRKDQDQVSCPRNSSLTKIRIKYSNYEMCQCDEGLHPTPNNQACVLARTFGESCGENENQCSKASRLTCSGSSKVCACNENEIWEQPRQMCVLLEGQSGCTPDMNNCMNHASCGSRYHGHCSCIEGYSTTGRNEHFCLGNYLSPCNCTEDCHKGTTCIDNVCECPDLQNQFYDKKQKNCIGLVGATCTDSNSCVQNSKCSAAHGLCECTAGFSKTSAGNCALLKGLGENCTGGQCNFEKGLACISGICSCFENSLIWDATKEGCVAGIEGKCGLMKTVGGCQPEDKNCDSYFVNCEDSGFCQHIGQGLSTCQFFDAPSDARS